MVFYWLNFQKRKKATLRTSKIILEVRRVAFLRYDTFALYNVHSIKKTIARLFFIIWVRWNLFCNFSGCRCPICKCFYIIRFAFPLAFQRRIPNCSTAKTDDATTKTKHKVENEGKGGGEVWRNLHPPSLFKIITQALYCTAWYKL